MSESDSGLAASHNKALVKRTFLERVEKLPQYEMFSQQIKKKEQVRKTVPKHPKIPKQKTPNTKSTTVIVD